MDLPETPEDYVAELRGKFGWEEYLVFALVLSMSAVIGIFYGFFSRREQNNEEFLMGGRSMNALPVSLSIMCSFVSALTVLGNPVETYLYGTQYMTIILCFIPLTAVLIFVYSPVYYKLQLTSAYEYFEIRFNSSLRMLLSLVHCFYLVFYMALVVYGPSLALKQGIIIILMLAILVTGFETLLSVAIIFAICIFYSTLGGFRAVIWTDALQGVIMIISVAVVAIKGTIDVGGFAKLWEKLEDTGRVSFFRFDPDPRTRHSFWAVFFGGFSLYLTMLAGMQANIQRYSSMPNIKTVKRSLLLNYVFLTLIIFLCTYCGIVVFAKYYMCDPINANLVDTTDQILPIFVMDIVGDIPGLPGLFVGGLTCASLSSVSSALNAMSAIVVEDYILKLKPDMSDRILFHASRAVSVISGFVSFAFIFIVQQMGDIFPAAVSLIGALISPTLGTFSLGMMFPWANSLGALLGVIASYIITLFISAGAAIGGANKDLPDQRCSLSTERCSEFFKNLSSIKNVDHSMRPSEIWKDRDDSAYTQLMTTSYLLFPLIGTLATIIFGLIFSGIVALCGWSKHEKPVNIDCLSPPFTYLWKRLFPEQMAKMISEESHGRDMKKGGLSSSRKSVISLSSNEKTEF